jgi:uncharacterized SAM-binding protein YcdF (DUF218 family)
VKTASMKSKSTNNRVLWILIPICLAVISTLFLLNAQISKGLWNFLVVNQEPKHSDVIIVLSGDTGRVEYGVELFHSGIADRILFTGGNETEGMISLARSLGVPPDAILIDNLSHTTFDNAENTADVMRIKGFKSAVAVTSAYHTRRAGIMLERFFKGFDLTVCAVPYDNSLSLNWWKSPTTAEKVIAEYLKLAYYYLFQT